MNTRLLLEDEDFINLIRIYINDYPTINKFINRVHNYNNDIDNDNLKFLFNIYENNHEIFINFYSFICKPSIMPPENNKTNMKSNYELLLSKKLVDDNKKVLLALTRTNNNLNMALRYIINY